MKTVKTGLMRFSKPAQRMILDGAQPYRFSDPLDQDMVEFLLNTEPGHRDFIGELFTEVLPSEKRRFKKHCLDMGGKIKAKYCRHASSWASVLNCDSLWHLEDFEIIYSGHVGAGYLDKVLITTANIRFAVAANGTVCTFPEFKWKFGTDVVSRIEERRDAINKELDSVIEHITSEMVLSLISYTKDGYVGTAKFPGLACIPKDKWHLPDGCISLGESTTGP